MGADSTLGRALLLRLQELGLPCLGTTRRDGSTPDRLPLDLAGIPADWRPPEGVAVAYLCAAVTSTNQCRSDPEGTRRTNVIGTLAVARTLREAGAHLVFLSTNLVFDGSVPHQRAYSPTCPQTEYGRQKAEVEAKLLEQPGATVLRLTKVLTSHMGLVQGWLSELREGRSIQPLSDLPLAPVSLPQVVEALSTLGLRRPEGIFQLSARDDFAYAEMAQLLAKGLGVEPGLVQPICSKDAGLDLEHVPRFTSLDTSRAEQELGFAAPEAQAVVRSVFATPCR
ncbi:MAG: sugar nucleotide-binding protein [Armatimonadia bacterium]